MSRTSKNDATVARRIGALKRVIDASLMELTEVEVLINAKCGRQVEGGELERTRMVLTNAIVKMDAELKQLQRGVTRAEQPLASSNEARSMKVTQEKYALKRRGASDNTLET